jgi:lipoprotein-anchoring transpeptidase ErfK/SrfK
MFRFVFAAFFLALVQPSFATVTKAEVDFSRLEEAGTVIISTSERALYYVIGKGRAYKYSIAVGSEGNEWFGKSVVTRKAENPSWFPTKDQKSKNPRLPNRVDAGPSNPLGARAIYLGWSALRVHGTIAPSSIGRAASGGCFRMHNADVIDLYKYVHIGAPVIVE